MGNSDRRFFVLPHERVLKDERIVAAWGFEHFLVSLLFGLILWGGVLVAVFLLAPEMFGTAAPVLAALLTAQLVLSGLYVWRRIVTTEYIVTEEAVYTRRGRLVLSVSSALMDRVTDLHVHTSLVGRIFGYSGLSVRTAGGGVWMPGLRDPYLVRGTIQQARHVFIAQLLRESGRDVGTTVPSRAGPETTDIQCPNCDFLFGVPRGPRPLDVQCPRCKETGAIFEEAAA